MPWCEECSKYLPPSALKADGTCPTCGRRVGEIEEKAATAMEQEKAPWHFKLMVVLLIAYLGWRLVDIFV